MIYKYYKNVNINKITFKLNLYFIRQLIKLDVALLMPQIDVL